MTKAQERAIRFLKIQAESTLFFGAPDKHEFKKFEVTESDFGPVFLTIETGLKGDEGTLAEVYARDWCHLVIGKKGGITWYRTKNGKTVERFWCEHHSILQAVIDQRY